MTELTTDLKSTLTKSLRTLDSDICRVERELDLELENLGDLLDRRHPDVARQLQALNGSIGQLHESLAAVRRQLREARSETVDLHDSLESARNREESTKSADPAVEGRLSASDAETERHSGSVTLGSILRGLLMAEEPAQRHGND